MKKLALIFIAILMLACSSPWANGQAPFGNMQPGPGAPPMALTPPGFPGGYGVPQPYGCPPPCAQMCGPLAFYTGYMVSDKRGFQYKREPEDDASGPDLVFRFPLQGVVLATSGTFPLSENLGVIAAGGWLLPNKTVGDFNQEGTVETPLTSHLEADSQWGIIDGAGYFTFFNAGWGCFQFLGGFRWDHLTSRQTISSHNAGGPGTFTSAATNDITVDAYIPYFGFQLLQTSTCSRFAARVIGFPVAPGTVRFNESSSGTEDGVVFLDGGEFNHPFKRSYFIEASAEYSMKILGDISLGGFALFNTLHGKTDFGTFVGQEESRSELINLTRLTWTFGGSISYSFSTGF